MSLTWKDGVTTLLAGIVAVFTYLMATGYPVPYISGFRWATLVLLVLGMGMCAFSSAAPSGTSPWITLATVLGVLAIILVIMGFVTGAKTVFIVLGGTILLLWLIATTRHLLT